MILVFAIGLANAELLRVGPGENSLWVISSNSSETVLQYRISNFERQRVDINGEAYNRIRLPKEGISQDKGMPELPVYNRSIIIDGISRMKLEVYDLEYLEMKLPVAPSKGVITRDINPETVPYTFAPVYGESGFYPQQIAKLSEPYILRDFRGITIQTAPFAYDPQPLLRRRWQRSKLLAGRRERYVSRYLYRKILCRDYCSSNRSGKQSYRL